MAQIGNLVIDRCAILLLDGDFVQHWRCLVKRVLLGLLLFLLVLAGLTGCGKLDPYDPDAVAIISQRLNLIQQSKDISQQQQWIANPVTIRKTIGGLGTSTSVLTAAQLQAASGDALVLPSNCAIVGIAVFVNEGTTVETRQQLACQNYQLGQLTVNMGGSYSTWWSKLNGEWILTEMELTLKLQ